MLQSQRLSVFLANSRSFMFNASPKFMEKLEAQSKSSSTLPPDQRAFLDAARAGDAGKVRELLAKGVPVDLREDFCVHYHQNEQTALMYAAGGGHLEMVRLLLKAGADVKAIDKMISRESGGEKTALHYAAEQPNVAVVEELLNAGGDPNALAQNIQNRGYTPLIYALQKGHRDIAQLLIKHGTNLGAKIGRARTMSPLVALIGGSEGVPHETIRDLFLQLLEAKADPNGEGDGNQTCAFSLAANDVDNARHLPAEIANELLEKLLKAGARPDRLDKFGSIPLQDALIRKNPGAVKRLLEAGADVNFVFKRGTALDINESDIKMCKDNLQDLKKTPPPANERTAEVLKQACITNEGKLQRCKEIGEILCKFGAKRKSKLPAT
jgi:ankyrin repeat protein